MYLLGIDLGTSFWKAALYDASGRVVAESVTPAEASHGGRFDYYDPDRLWKSVSLLIRKIVRQAGSPGMISGVAVAGMAESGVPLDGKGNAIYPIIAWYDKCTAPQAEWWLKKVDRKKAHGITGLYIKHIYSVNKLMWLRDNEPAVFRKMAKWLCLPDYIVYKLTGRYTMDYSIASRTMLLDIKKRKWSGKLLEYAGLDSSILPTLYPAGAAVERVSRRAAEATGLSRKTVVVTGGHDHVCGAFAAGAVSEGGVFDSIGTAECLFTVVDKPVLSGGVYRSGFSSGCHVQPGKYYIMGGIYTSGAVVDWVISLLFGGRNLTRKKKTELYKKTIEKSLKSPGTQELFLLPYFRGSGPPGVDYSRRGVMYGLDLSHDRRDIVNAAISGLCCESRRLAEALEACVGGKIKKYSITGSLAGIRDWMQLKANVLNRTVEVIDVPEAGTLGAAMLAGIGSGLFSSFSESRRRMKVKKVIIRPNPFTAGKFRDYYEKYKSLSEL